MVPLRALALVSLLLAAALAGCATPPEDGDADDDGLSDVEEATGWTVVAETRNGTVTHHATSDPTLRDSDEDGLSDLEEFRALADPRALDTDGDGLLDGKGLVAAPGSDLGKRLAAAGILRDPANEGRWLGEADLCPETGGLRPLKHDSDRPSDGLSDGEETLGWLIVVAGESRRVFSSPCVADSDSDGLLDGDEKLRGSDPSRRDTDDDGVWDSVDADPLVDVGLRIRVESLTLAREPEAGATARLSLLVVGAEESFERPARAGEVRFDAVLAHNVDDTTDPRGGTLAVQLILKAVLVAANGTAMPLDIGGEGDGSLLDARYDVIRGTWTLGETRDAAGPLVSEGPDGALKVTLARQDY